MAASPTRSYGVARRGRPRRVAGVLGGVLVAVLAVVAVAVPASASPGPSVSQIEAQINQVWNALEPLIEKYNQVHDQLVSDRKKEAQLETEISPLELQVGLSQTRVGVISAQLFKNGPGARLTVLVNAGSPLDFADQLTTLGHLAHTQAKTIGDAKALVAQYDQKRQPLLSLIATEQQEDAKLAAQKAAITAQLNQLQALRLAAYGSSVSTGILRPVACPQAYIGGAPGKAVAYACSHIGAKYVWATAGPNTFDCSGLTEAAWAAAGVALAHFTGAQINQTTRISQADLRPGDLVFFFSDYHHVALYVGGGWVVHAPHPGDFVRMALINDIATPTAFRRP